MKLFKWVNIFVASKSSYRQNIVKYCLEAIRICKRGVKTKSGDDWVKFLNKADKQLVGVTSEITYIMVDNKDKSNLNVLWTHPFSVPTLVYHIKGTPFLLLANANLDYNNSKLLEIGDNKELAENEQWKKNLGLQG